MYHAAPRATRHSPYRAGGAAGTRFVYRKSQKSLTWYADGEHDTAYGAVSFDSDDDASDLYFARGDSFGAEALDEIAIYDQALSLERIARHVDAARR